MERKYVIYLGIFFLPDRNSASQRAMAFAGMIHKMGYTPIIIGVDDRISSETDILSTETEFKYGYYYSMKYPESKADWLKFIADIRNIRRVMEHLDTKNIHALIAMDYYAVALSRLMRYCKRKNIRMIVDTVDWFSKASGAVGLIKNFDTEYRMQVVNKRSDYMITISRYLTDYYRGYVRNLVEIPGIVSNDMREEADRSGASISEDCISICFVGDPGIYCQKEKINWVIKKICDINRDAVKMKFHIAGIDAKTLLSHNQDLAELPNFDESVVCYGRLPHKECISLICRSDFAAIIREDNRLSRAGFPTKLAETFACGTPVIVTPSSNISDYIPATHGCIAKDCTQDAVSELLQKLSLMDRSEINAMREAVRKNNPLNCDNFIVNLEKMLGNRGD